MRERVGAILTRDSVCDDDERVVSPRDRSGVRRSRV